MPEPREDKVITTVYITKSTYKKMKVFVAKKLTSISDVMEQALLAFFDKKV